MIIFTVTNKTTSQVYVGSTRNDLLDQWEKMVAAAEQNLNYPLYQEIRAHGRDGFVVEEWDYVEDRSELAALEQEAIESFNAKSLRGYKTSTVKIQPKKKTRTRKSSIEKELASIFAEVAAESKSDDEPPSLALKSTQTQTPDKKPANTVKAATIPTSKPNAVQLASAMTSAVNEALSERAERAQTQASKEEAKAATPEIPLTASQANAVVQMNDINLSDDITAQLAAIQAAADAVLAGDSSAAADLSAPKAEEEPQPEVEEVKTETTTQPVTAPEPETVVELDPKQQRIRDAIERQRSLRAKKTTDRQKEERQHIAKLLSELMDRANTLHGLAMTVAA